MSLIEYIDKQIKEWTDIYNNPSFEEYRGETMARLDTLRDIKRKAKELEAEK